MRGGIRPKDPRVVGSKKVRRRRDWGFIREKVFCIHWGKLENQGGWVGSRQLGRGKKKKRRGSERSKPG